MEAWHLWLIAALLLMIAELLGTSFVAFALGLAALCATLLALADLPASVQWLGFAVSAALLAPLLRHLFHRYAPSHRRSALAGEEQALEGMLILDAQGQLKVKVESDTFLVRSLSQRQLTPGTAVVVRRFDGITALVD